MNRITAMYPPFYRRLEFCNLLIRGRLPKVLIAEPCINFTRCRAGFSAGEGCEVEQTAREAAMLLRVRWCEFAWLIGLVALAIILGGPFVGAFLDSRAAGRGRVCWEVGVAWIFASRSSFGEGAGRFCQCLLGAVLARPADTTRLDGARAEEVVSGLRIWIRRSHPSRRRGRVGHSQNLKRFRSNGWATRPNQQQWLRYSS